MATKNKQADEPDLFSAANDQSRFPLNQALQQLSDDDFRRLAAVLNEQKRRDKNSIAPTEKSENQRWEVGVRALSVGQLNVVRAAFKAGVKPTQIANQFGLSKSNCEPLCNNTEIAFYED